MPTKLPIKWQRFSLRSLFVLMTACSLLFGVWAAYVNPFRVQKRSLAEVYRLQGLATTQAANGPRWQRWLVTNLLGVDGFVRVTDVKLQGQAVDDEALRSLTGLVHLKTLSVADSRITDQGVESILKLKDLNSLSLRYANISDRSVKYVAMLPTLEHLQLTGTNVTDACISDLATCPHLSELFLRWTKITNSGAEQIAASLSNCAVYHHALVNE